MAYTGIICVTHLHRQQCQYFSSWPETLKAMCSFRHCFCMDIRMCCVPSVSKVWWLSYLTHCLSHSLQPSISEAGSAKALCSFTPAFVASLALPLSSPCLKTEKGHKAGYCTSSLGCWLLSALLWACQGLKQQTTQSTDLSNIQGKT